MGGDKMKLKWSVLLIISCGILFACNGSGSSANSGVGSNNLTSLVKNDVILGNESGIVYRNGNPIPGAGANGSLDGSPVTALLVSEPTAIYAGTQNGNLYLYNTSTSNWQDISSYMMGVGTGAVVSLAITQCNYSLCLSNPFIVVAFSQNGIVNYLRNPYSGVYQSILPYNNGVFVPGTYLAGTSNTGLYIGSANNQGIYASNYNVKNKTYNTSSISPAAYGTITAAISSLMGGTVYMGDKMGSVLLFNTISTGNTYYMGGGDKILDGSAITSLGIDNGANFYAGTESGAVFTSSQVFCPGQYACNIVTVNRNQFPVPGEISTPVAEVAVDNSNTIYIAKGSILYAYHTNPYFSWTEANYSGSKITSLALVK